MVWLQSIHIVLKGQWYKAVVKVVKVDSIQVQFKGNGSTAILETGMLCKKHSLRYFDSDSNVSDMPDEARACLYCLLRIRLCFFLMHVPVAFLVHFLVVCFVHVYVFCFLHVFVVCSMHVLVVCSVHVSVVCSVHVLVVCSVRVFLFVSYTFLFFAWYMCMLLVSCMSVLFFSWNPLLFFSCMSTLLLKRPVVYYDGLEGYVYFTHGVFTFIYSSYPVVVLNKGVTSFQMKSPQMMIPRMMRTPRKK